MTFDFGLNTNHQSSENASSRANHFIRHNMDSMRDQPMPEWLVPGVMFQRQVGVLWGKPGSFKSFINHDLCARAVHGLEWQGRYLKPCRVIYVAGEGYSMFYNRRLAWFQHNGIDPENDGLDVIQGAVDLTNGDEVALFISEMQQDCEGVGLVVFDTLSTCIAGQNESDSAVMSLVIQHARKISDALNSTVLFVHHPGKDETRGSRGSSALRGNIDFELHLTRDGLNCTMEVTKQKDAEDGQKYHYVGKKVWLDRYDSDGEQMSSMGFTPLVAQSTQTQTDMKLAADLRSVVIAMTMGEQISLTGLAKKMHHLGKERNVRDRISAAVPTEWTRVTQFDTPANIRRVLGRNGTPTLIDLQPVSKQPEMLF